MDLSLAGRYRCGFARSSAWVKSRPPHGSQRGRPGHTPSRPPHSARAVLLGPVPFRAATLTHPSVDHTGFYSRFISTPDAAGRRLISTRGEEGREGGKGRRGCLSSWAASASEPGSQQNALAPGTRPGAEIRSLEQHRRFDRETFLGVREPEASPGRSEVGKRKGSAPSGPRQAGKGQQRESEASLAPPWCVWGVLRGNEPVEYDREAHGRAERDARLCARSCADRLPRANSSTPHLRAANTTSSPLPR